MTRDLRAVFEGIGQYGNNAGQPAFMLNGLFDEIRFRVQINRLLRAVLRLDV